MRVFSYSYLGILSEFDPADSLVTSPFFGTFALGTIRATLALYSLLAIIVDLGLGCADQLLASACASYVLAIAHVTAVLSYANNYR